MKKLFVISCAAALTLISISGTAQVQDADTASTDYNRQQMERTGDDMEDETERTGNELRRETEQAGDELEQGADRAGDEFQEGAERAGDEIDQGLERTEEGIEDAGNEINENTQPTDETEDPSNQEMNQDRSYRNTDDNMGNTRGETDTAPQDEANRSGARDQSFANPIEVLEEKEGPENQVVYKYKGELFYVDREEGKLVQTKRSELKDVNQNKIIESDQQAEDDR